MSKDRSKSTTEFFNKHRYSRLIEREGDKNLSFHGNGVLEEKDIEGGEEVNFLAQEDEEWINVLKVRRVDKIGEEG